MTKEHADEILTYVAQEIISPMAFDTRSASKYWDECIGDKFNKLCEKVLTNPPKCDIIIIQ